MRAVPADNYEPSLRKKSLRHWAHPVRHCAGHRVNDRLVVEEMNVLTDVVTLRVTGRTDCHVASLLAMTPKSLESASS